MRIEHIILYAVVIVLSLCNTMLMQCVSLVSSSLPQSLSPFKDGLGNCIIRIYCIIIRIAYCWMWYCCLQKMVLLHLTHKHKYPYFLNFFQETVVSPILRLMARCLFLVPLLDTQSLTAVPQGISSLEAPAELVKIVGNGLALNHIVLVSYVCYY